MKCKKREEGFAVRSGAAHMLNSFDAYRAAQDASTAGVVLNRLFQATFAVAKRVRTETNIGANAVSVASAASCAAPPATPPAGVWSCNRKRAGLKSGLNCVVQ
jgi:hypothetical protein